MSGRIDPPKGKADGDAAPSREISARFIGDVRSRAILRARIVLERQRGAYEALAAPRKRPPDARRPARPRDRRRDERDPYRPETRFIRDGCAQHALRGAAKPTRAPVRYEARRAPACLYPPHPTAVGPTSGNATYAALGRCSWATLMRESGPPL